MIVLNLSCRDGHRFEGWFASRASFEVQLERGLVNCSHCQISEVTVLPSGPMVKRAHPTSVAPRPDQDVNGSVLERLMRLLHEAAQSAENVGKRFPDEARRIHYDEAPARTIRGVASAEETRELLAEGILVLPVPGPKEDLH